MLGQAMAESGLLPEAGLVWFLTHWELGQTLTRLSPGLVRKAVRRRQLFPAWDGRKFREMERGGPARLEEDSERSGPARVTGDTAGLRGTPACPGCVVAPARVVTNISQAANIRPGDILVTHSTGNKTHNMIARLHF